jgi:hypothetical protein
MNTLAKLISIPKFARATGLTSYAARIAVERGDVPSVQIGDRRKIDEKYLERWLAGCFEPRSMQQADSRN